MPLSIGFLCPLAGYPTGSCWLSGQATCKVSDQIMTVNRARLLNQRPGALIHFHQRKVFVVEVSSEVAKSRKRRKSKEAELLADRVLAYLRKHRSCFFSELAEEFPEFIEGTCDLDFIGRDHSNIIAWTGLTIAAHQAINLLQKRGAISYRAALQPIEQLMHRTVLKFPISNQPRHYKTTHWLPVAIHAVTKH